VTTYYYTAFSQATVELADRVVYIRTIRDNMRINAVYKPTFNIITLTLHKFHCVHVYHIITIFIYIIYIHLICAVFVFLKIKRLFLHAFPSIVQANIFAILSSRV
jgi:hypothetical protein